MRALSSVESRPELRAFPRERVNRAAKVLQGRFSFEARFKDISKGGARIQFRGQAPLSDDLVVIDVELATAYVSKVVWRKDGECGLSFYKSQDLRGLVSREFEEARRVWHAAGAR
jgi:hypothetical protein